MVADRRQTLAIPPRQRQQAKNMLKNSKDGDRAYAAIGMFAGVRPEEITRLDWRYVDLENSKVVSRQM
jgi:integrase